MSPTRGQTEENQTLSALIPIVQHQQARSNWKKKRGGLGGAEGVYKLCNFHYYTSHNLIISLYHLEEEHFNMNQQK